MSYLDSIAHKVRRGEPLPVYWDYLLRAATPVTRWSMHRRLRQSPVAVDARVVSFGNLTAGGTGKTPAVIERVQQELAQGRKVAVVTRGYGSRSVSEPFAVRDTMTQAEIVRDVGDEPALIRYHAPECIIIKAARRLDGARLAIDTCGCDLVLLDDAYQHVQLARDENICLIDSSNPFGSGFLLPRGILREPLSALTRATSILFTRCDQAKDLAGLRRLVGEWVPACPIRETIHAPGRLWNLRSGMELPLNEARQGRISAVSGIGNPEAFTTTLEGLGLTVSATHSYRDHAPLPREALCGPERVITTEKDAMRISDPPDNVFALEIVLKDWSSE